MRQRGFSLLEVFVAVAVGVAVLGAMTTVFMAVQRMSQAGELAGSLQDAAMAMAYIEKDLTQAVQKPDPSVDSAVIVGPAHFQMLRATPLPDGGIQGTLVVYNAVGSPGGNFRLRRRVGPEDRTIPGLFRAVRFPHLKGPGGPFVRVTLRVASHDTAAAATSKASEEAVLTALVRVMGPEMIGGRAFSWGFMESLNAIGFLKDL